MESKNVENELIKKAKENDEKAKLLIIEKMTPYIRKVAKSYFIHCYTEEDLVQFGIVSVLKSIDSYDLKRYTNFFGYAALAIKNNYGSLLRKEYKKSEELSLNRADEKGTEIIETLFSDEQLEDECILKTQLIELRETLGLLTKEEKNFIIYIYMVKHGGIKAYSEKYGVKYSSCISMRDRIIKKLKNNMKDLE